MESPSLAAPSHPGTPSQTLREASGASNEPGTGGGVARDLARHARESLTAVL